MIAPAWSLVVLLSTLQALPASPLSELAQALGAARSEVGTRSAAPERRTLLGLAEDSLESGDRGEYATGAPPSAPQAPPGPPGQPPSTGRRTDKQTVYVIEFETEAEDGLRNRGGKDARGEGGEGQSPLDPWSIVWYIGSFGGLVAFFLIVSCSEWCCRRGARGGLAGPLAVPYTQRGEVIAQGGQQASESPPPPYHLFAPPPYDSVNYADLGDKRPCGPAEKLDIYVISLPAVAAPAPAPQQVPRASL